MQHPFSYSHRDKPHRALPCTRGAPHRSSFKFQPPPTRRPKPKAEDGGPERRAGGPNLLPLPKMPPDHQQDQLGEITSIFFPFCPSSEPFLGTLLPLPPAPLRGQGHLHVQVTDVSAGVFWETSPNYYHSKRNLVLFLQRRPSVLQRGVQVQADLHGRGEREEGQLLACGGLRGGRGQAPPEVRAGRGRRFCIATTASGLGVMMSVCLELD